MRYLLLAPLLAFSCSPVAEPSTPTRFGFTCTGDLIPPATGGALVRCVNEEVVCYFGHVSYNSAALYCREVR